MTEFDKVKQLLPQSVLEIIDVIGFTATEQLVRKIGGARFKFGKGKIGTQRLEMLIDAIGEEKTNELLKVFGGDEFYLPRCGDALRELRNQRFRAEFSEMKIRDGVSGLMAMTVLCPKYGISDRMGYQILKQKTPPSLPQNELF